MDFESSSKFISSLAKFLQSLCNGYVEFDNGVQVIGHLYLNVDTGKTIDYVLNEKVCKTDENSVTFISNSFHAQPAEKPKPPGKSPDVDFTKTDHVDPDRPVSSDVELKSTNVGTVPSAQIHGSSSFSDNAKRPFPINSKHRDFSSGNASPRHKKRKMNYNNESGGLVAPAPEGPRAPFAANPMQQPPSITGSPFNETYPQNFLAADDGSLRDSQELQDIKPSFDTDVTFIKEESINSEANNQQDSPSLFPESYSAQPLGPDGISHSQRLPFNPAMDRSMYSTGSSLGDSGDATGDSSGVLRHQNIDYLPISPAQLSKPPKTRKETNRNYYQKLKSERPAQYQERLKKQAESSKEYRKEIARDPEKLKRAKELARERVKRSREKKKTQKKEQKEF